MNKQTIITPNNFAIAMKAERIESGLSQRELAQMAGIDHTYLSKIENGKVDPPSTDVIVCLCFAMESDRVNKLLSLSGRIDKDLLRMAIDRDANVSKVISALIYGYLSKSTVAAMLRLVELEADDE